MEANSIPLTQEAHAQLTAFEQHLRNEERSDNTIAKYLRDVRAFFNFLKDAPLDKRRVLQFKETLCHNYAPSSINSMLAALNSYLSWIGRVDCKVKALKIQRSLFARPERELSRQEYQRLVACAEQQGKHRLALLLQSICSTGIRVSELSFLTTEAMQSGRAHVNCKGKRRTVFLPKALCLALRQFCRKEGISKGLIFCSASGRALDRSNIWKMLKGLCKAAGVDPRKGFPHNLRHLFARTYYQLEKDISRLADLLGHSSINTTRLYTMESGNTHNEQLSRMHLVLCKSQKTT